MDIQTRRGQCVTETLARVRELLPGEPDSRATLEQALQALIALAGQRELWQEHDFPLPDESERQARYLISEDADRRYALYLNVMRPGKRISPHNHTTWACVAAVDGVEHNELYRRVDHDDGPGRADVRSTGTVDVAPGRGVALLADDIHAVQIPGVRAIRHLHLYGRALETLSERLTFDPEAGTCAPMAIGVRTRH